MLEFEPDKFSKDIIVSAAEKDARLIDLLPEDLKQKLIAEAESWKAEQEKTGKTEGELNNQHLELS